MSLRDISPHRGESPFSREPITIRVPRLVNKTHWGSFSFLFAAGTSEKVVNVSEIIFVYTVYCFLGGSELPVAERSAGNIHTRVRAEAAHILIRNDGKLCRRAPHGFDNLAAGRAVISAVAPLSPVNPQ